MSCKTTEAGAAEMYRGGRPKAVMAGLESIVRLPVTDNATACESMMLQCAIGGFDGATRATHQSRRSLRSNNS